MANRRTCVLLAAIAAVLGVSMRVTAHAEHALPHAAADARNTAEKVCAACHGADGNSPSSAVPSLAGQNADYLDDQLQQFAAQGHRRANGVMGAIAVHLSRDQMRALADYFSYQQLIPSNTTDRPVTQLGASIYRAGIPSRDVPACASCHGRLGQGLAPSFPRLAGQHARYVATELRQFRSGARASDPDALMRTIAAPLSDKEVEAVALYVSALR